METTLYDITAKGLTKSFVCFFLEVWKADDQMEREHRSPDEQARPFIIFKNQAPLRGCAPNHKTI